MNSRPQEDDLQIVRLVCAHGGVGDVDASYITVLYNREVWYRAEPKLVCRQRFGTVGPGNGPSVNCKGFIYLNHYF
jgi:hypothetical protein